NLTYTPASNAFGSATVTVILKDDGGTANGGVDSSPAETFTITVTSVNDAPTFIAGSDQTVLEDAGAQSVTAWATAISSGPENESGQTLAFTVTNDNNSLFSTQPAIDATGNLTYTPVINAFGSATVNVILKDDGGIANGGVDTSNNLTFTITVSPVNDKPVAVNSSVSLLENEIHTFGSGDFGFSDVNDVPDAIESISLAASPDKGTLLYNGNPIVTYPLVLSASEIQNLTYQPVINEYGNPYTSLLFKVSDDNQSLASNGKQWSDNQATLNIEVVNTNQAPTDIQIVSGTVLENLSGAIAGTLTCSDPDPMDVHTYTLVQNPNNLFVIDGNILKLQSNVQLNHELISSVTIQVKVTDADQESYTKILVIWVLNANEAPSSASFEFTTRENKTHFFSRGDFEFYDEDYNDSFTGIRIIRTENMPGSLYLDINGNRIAEADEKIGSFPLTIQPGQINSLCFVAVEGECGDDLKPIFEFKILDARAESSDNWYTASATIYCANNAPTATNQEVETDVNQTFTFAGQTFGFSDTDSGDALGAVRIKTLPAKGQLYKNGIPVAAETVIPVNELLQLSYTPEAGEFGDNYASFQFDLQDMNLTATDWEPLFSINSYSFTFNVNRLNSAPYSANQTLQINEDETYSFASSDFPLIDENDTEDMLSKVVIKPTTNSDLLRYNGEPISEEIEIPAESLPLLQFKYADQASGSFTFEFQVIDNNSVQGSNGEQRSGLTYTYTIQVLPVNDAPVIANPLADVQVDEFSDYDFTAGTSIFSDPDGDVLVIQVQVISGNWIQKKGDNLIEGFPLPDSDDKAVVTVRATDPKGLWVEDTFELTVLRKNRPLIYGQIKSSLTLPDNLPVALMMINENLIDSSAVTVTNSRDYYYFEGVQAGNYIVKAVNNNPADYPQLGSTYYETTSDWTEALQIEVKPETEYQADIVMLVNPITLGEGAISGFVRVITTSSPSNAGTINQGNQGDPLPFADIWLTKKGEPNVLLYTQTKPDGSYQFKNVPAGEYIVSARLPGFTSINPYSVIIGAGKNIYENINFLAYLGDGVITDKTELNQFDMILFPNPTSGLINLRGTNFDKTLHVKVISMSGQSVMTKQFEPASLLQFDLKGLRPATYIIEVKHGDRVKTFPVLLMNSK
ncbi:MAG: carboxypeptidase regulatory-like domain-containing protein, partial [Prolixibacteraceae bacterium]|nr:carboxypeptidase regulatory-like domain-containing protein [Prolixibacteraceae bacterium]